MGALVASVARHLLTVLAGVLLAKGWINLEVHGQLLQPEIVGFVASVAVALAWSGAARARAAAKWGFALIQRRDMAPEVFEGLAQKLSTPEMRQAVDKFVPFRKG
jgi:hypothetical protein